LYLEIIYTLGTGYLQALKIIEKGKKLNIRSEPSRLDIYKLFDRIAPRYDIFNAVSSFDLDFVWRRRLARLLKNRKDLKVLDIATGTGDLLLALFDAGCNISSAVGLDMSANMLAIADRKFRRRNLSAKIILKQADALSLPFPDTVFNAVTCAFGIRNLTDVAEGLIQMRRVLKPAGRLLILEFSLPRNRPLKTLYLFYLRNIVPLLGKIIAGQSIPFRYLNQTIEIFPAGPDFCTLLQNAGFVNVQPVPLTFGVVTLYLAEKS